MASDDPEPQEADGPGAQAAPGPQARVPRVLVSVDDFEDPAEWDVIVVENDAIDDDTARAIARSRAARDRPPRSITLPSLDERDVMRAFDTDRDAESPEGVGVDAFAPPEPVPVRRRPATEIALPTLDPFEGLPEPEPEPGATPEPDPPATDAAPAGPAAHPTTEPAPVTPLGAQEATEVDPSPTGGEDRAAWSPAAFTMADPGEAPGPTAAPPPAEAGAADQGGPADVVAPQLRDDPADAFFSIGDGTTAPVAAPPPPAPEPTGVAWGQAPEALDRPRDLLDDPADDFYDVGAEEDPAARAAAAAPAAPTAPEAEDGAEPAEGDHAVLAGPAAGGATEPAPEPGDPFEDEVEFDSSFPLGPDDLKVEGHLEPVDLDTLDYAAVFGPVRGSIHDPDREPPRPRRRARLAYEDDLFLDDAEDEDEDRYPVTPVKARGRRRELVVLGIAAGVMIAIGVGSQIYSGDDAGLEATDTTTTTRERTRATAAPDPALTLPSLPTDTSPELGEAGDTTDTTQARTTTTRRRSTPPTAGPTTPSTAPTTTASTTTTTEAPTTTASTTTTTTEPPTTTAPPGP